LLGLRGWLLLSLWVSVAGQLHYSVMEESDPGTVVGKVAQDLGLTAAALSRRRLQLGSEESKRFFALGPAGGTLLVNEKIDREALCGASEACVLPVQVVIEQPLELFHLEVEVRDLNDNAPGFPAPGPALRIAESAPVGSRFPLESAHDADVGTNAVSAYQLGPNPHFSLNVRNVKGGKLLPELVLEQPLDRERQAEHRLVLTARDGGSPVLSGTAQITVVVLDSNDNEPAFDLPVYKVSFLENTPVGALLFSLNATDPDAGSNGEIQYSFGIHTPESIQKLFGLDPHTGEIHVKGAVDFEEAHSYELHIRARDKGIPQLEGHCVIQLEVEDENDHPPEVLLTSLVSPVPENTPLDTVVGLFSVRDQDSGANGKVHLQISPDVPFKIKSFENHYSLMTRKQLDREAVSQYAITLTARDSGSPPLSTNVTVVLNISDVNDNAPRFTQQAYNTFLKENNPPGSLLCTVAASDPDEGDNARLTYSVMGSQFQGAPISSLVYVNPESGDLYAQHSFDYERLQVFQVAVEVKDAGFPPLSSTATLHLFVLDQNDNAPVIVHPQVPKGSSFHQSVLLPMDPGHLVTKVVAVDADSGHNAWLSYRLLQEPGEAAAFKVERHSGEIRVSRALREPGMSHRLVVEVQDNGVPSLSASLVLVISAEDSAAQDFSRSLDHLPRSPSRAPNLTLFLVISLVAISLVSCVMLAAVGARCLRPGLCMPSWLTSRCCNRRPDRKSTLNFCGRPSPEVGVRERQSGSLVALPAHCRPGGNAGRARGPARGAGVCLSF
uniref:Protocadherin gamma-C5 n=1 Tax=Varanus komodoensis TaxID=61221 RepID=A0A8D2LK66_VARKO